MADAAPTFDAYAVPLEDIDVTDPRLHQRNVVGEYFKRLRKEDPVHHCANSPLGPYWSITKFNDIMHVDTNHQIFSSHGTTVLDDDYLSGGHVEGGVEQLSFIARDPPVHDEQRKAVSPAVAPNNLKLMEPLIRERVRRVLDGLPIGERFDWVEKVSIELTTLMLATLMDFPLDERRKLTYWSNVATGEPGDGVVESWEHRNETLIECAAYFMELWKQRMDDPDAADLISMMARSPATRNMSPAEFIGNIVLLIVGGNDTTRNSMSGGVLAMHENPAELAKLQGNHTLLDSAIPEIIRWQTPVIYQSRKATQDTEVGGKKIRKGEKVAMWYISGNRDEEVIDRPDEFIIDRPRARHHLSFGFGVHRCVGNRLAELQLRILWEEILSRFRRIEVVGEPEWLLSNKLRGISSMPVVLHAA